MIAPSADADRLNAGSLADRHAGGELGEKTALKAADGKLTYNQLRARANQAGNLLRSLGVRREERVLLALDDSTAFPLFFLGALRIGAVPVPLSPLDSDQNLRHYVEDSYARTMVVDAAALPRIRSALGGSPVQFLVKGVEEDSVIDLQAGLEAQPDDLELSPTHRDDMAFWLYSSGSTGRPKGVVHLHHDIEVTCRTYAEGVLGLRRDDVTFSTTKLSHAYGLGNGLSFPLWIGATSVLMSGPTKPVPILSALAANRPTVFFSVPALYVALLRESAGVVAEALASVRVCVSAAEALPGHVVEAWHDRFDLEILDGIGSTEMLHIFCSNRPGAVVPGSTGTPVPGYELRILDERGAPIAGPGTGRLEVCGDSCAAFYWHQHEKSKRCMRGDWYATGDVCNRAENGQYSYVGRDDDMMKIGGLWVSPTDMEIVLTEHREVAAAGVVGEEVEDVSRITAFVETEGPVDEHRLAEELRLWCKERLRRYECPHSIVFTDRLPRTPSGKVQRFKLRELRSDGAAR
jgi:benzoate-CoA ligase family protein